LLWQEEEGSYAKVYDAGRKLDLHNIHGFLPTKIIGASHSSFLTRLVQLNMLSLNPSFLPAAFLMNLHIIPRPVYFTRHGESIFNIHGLIGGDSSLSPKGEEPLT
jgi:hypothetical protein